ncbi:class I SAM-dependent methyltransferase [Actinocorallia sp. A-T 12471]|uniref:class I SAM-dependent methyltransferase n=1 Tax=Actinocorallia sp. A-T 12471 TaxID=3089813 RepID=UPI0029CB340D|nr:class I SAM-dependent methyltransferase [Actinocorallia sp. A-T 12471]MDX6742463.1 class I SAM-dependent methyltransferase [Actinocorallia sp. A-T 12471]
MILPGVAAYDENAAELVAEYERLRFADVHAGWLDLLPAAPARVLDVGAGSGRDAAALSRLGHRVTAVEPSDGLRTLARRRHADVPVVWLDDALPALPSLGDARFDLVLLSAVWMHLAPDERSAAMRRVAELLAPSGTAVLTLRLGPPPPGRRMFEVDPDGTAALGAREGLRVVRRVDSPDLLERPGVGWTAVAFGKPQTIPT